MMIKANQMGMQMDIDLRPAKKVRSMIDSDGAVLLDLEHGKYYSLNGVGADIWRGVESGQSLPSILSDLQKTYDAPKASLESDLTAFVAGLREKGLVHAVR